jgi:hypothetical protein
VNARLAALVVLAVLSAVGSASAATALRFTRVAQNSLEGPPNMPDVGSYFGMAWTDAAADDIFKPELTAEQERKLAAVDFNTHFVISAELRSRTSGWSLTIKRVVLQRVSRAKREFCVFLTVKRPKPGTAIVQRPHFNVDLVSLPSRRFRVDEFHWNVPKALVLLTTSGTVLYRSTEGTDQQNRPIVTGNAKACRR